MTSQSSSAGAGSISQTMKHQQTSTARSDTTITNDGNRDPAINNKPNFLTTEEKIANRVKNAPKSPTNVFSKWKNDRKQQKKEKNRPLAEQKRKEEAEKQQIGVEKNKYSTCFPDDCGNAGGGQMINGKRVSDITTWLLLIPKLILLKFGLQ